MIFLILYVIGALVSYWPFTKLIFSEFYLTFPESIDRKSAYYFMSMFPALIQILSWPITYPLYRFVIFNKIIDLKRGTAHKKFLTPMLGDPQGCTYNKYFFLKEIRESSTLMGTK